jgi:hypothetical protein
VVYTTTTLQGGGPTPGSCKKRISNAPRLDLRITIHSRPRRDADHSNLPSDKVKNKWSYTYTPPPVCRRSMQKKNFTLTLQ